MTAFLVTASLMSALALVFVLRGLLAALPEGGAVSPHAANAAIHAAELAALDGELSAGRLSRQAYEAARDELLRRLLIECDTDRSGARAHSARWPGAAIAALAPLVAAGLYLLVGNPAALVSSGGATTVSSLETHLRHAPRDARAWVMLARSHMDANRFDAAARAYERAVTVSPKVATDAGIWCEWADALGMAQGASLQGRPRTLIDKALALSPGHPRALEMAGSAAYEAGEYARAAEHWDALLARTPAGSAEHDQLEAALARVRLRLAHAAPRQ